MSTVSPEYAEQTSTAVLDAVAHPRGVIDDSQTKLFDPTEKRSRKRSSRPKNGPVHVKLPAIGRWKCDAAGCKVRGYGPEAITKHNKKKPDHKIFSFKLASDDSAF